ncbi:MAG: type I DNA topoisomerase [Chlamydiia bacterium]|nr:type I DNA topoisomerase [Chlamydiia bacterium]
MKKRSLLVVESPAKIKTISKILGEDYKIVASFGHIRDLPSKSLGVDIEGGFIPKYVVPEDKKKYVQIIQSEAKKSSIVYLATDPDREGEAISWHISEILSNDVECKRITFNAIEEVEIKNALKNKRDININLVEAQKTRRILDRLCGFKGSSWLNKYMKNKNLSCGRVQSVALGIVAKREKEIKDFVAKTYWKFFIDFAIGELILQFELYSINKNKLESIKNKESVYLICSQTDADSVLKSINDSESFSIFEIIDKKIIKKSPAPYITSSLQQDASSKLGFNVKRTMKVAQDLYENGKITYMRTDSVDINKRAMTVIREYIEKDYKEFAEEKTKKYKSSKSAQQAHEAIRPTDISCKDMISSGDDHKKLYSLIWKRTMASQMKNAIYNNKSVLVKDSKLLMEFRASKQSQVFKGYTCVYKDIDEDIDNDSALEGVAKGSICILQKITPKETTTKPPGRFSEAALVKRLESDGVGRPSTYAPTIDKLGKYSEDKSGKMIIPTPKGVEVAGVIDKYLPILSNVKFTSEMEDNLEDVEQGKKTSLEVLEKFWKSFGSLIDIASKDIAATKKVESERMCPKCNVFLYEISWNDSVFFGCSNHPGCKHTESVSGEKKEIEINKEEFIDGFEWEQSCIKCKGPMKVRKGPYGIFLGCSKYPKCRNIVNIPKKSDLTGEFCGECDEGALVFRDSKKTYIYCIKCKNSSKNRSN